ncbi:MAG: LapA family protein [Pseudohongiellaceae bacterium]
MAGLAFLTANEDPVLLNFFVYDLQTTVGGSFVIGLILGLIVTLISTWPVIAAYKFKLGRAQKRSLDPVSR